LSPLGSATGYKVQGVGKSRGAKTPALSFPGVATPGYSALPAFPLLPGHSFYLVTPSGGDSLLLHDAIGDLLHIASWFVAVCARSEKGQRHMHYVVALPAVNDAWLSRHPKIFRSGRRIPCVTYSRGSGTGCSLSFSKITNVSGLKNYLEGPRNRAKFVTVLNPSPRAVWKPFAGIRQEERQEDKKVDNKDTGFDPPTPVYSPVCARNCTSLPGMLINLSVSSVQRGRQGIGSVDRKIRCHFDSS
jgi:hypothetical protein